jgi:hypothetical protein
MFVLSKSRLVFLFLCLPPLSLVFWLVLFLDSSHQPVSSQANSAESLPIHLNLGSADRGLVGNTSFLAEDGHNTGPLTAILPTTSHSLHHLHASLISLLHAVPEIIVACPEALFAETRRAVRVVVSNVSVQHHHAEIAVRSWAAGLDQSVGVVSVTSHVSTEHLLILDEAGLSDLDTHTRNTLLSSRPPTLPTGPRGILLLQGNNDVNITCLTPSDKPQRASYLLPPFVTPTALFSRLARDKRMFGGWAAIGKAMIADARADKVGGIVLGPGEDPATWCAAAGGNLPGRGSQTYKGIFAVLLPTVLELGNFSLLGCRLLANGYSVRVLLYREVGTLYEDDDDDSGGRTFGFPDGRCRLDYDVALPSPSSRDAMAEDAVFLEWLETWEEDPDVVLALKEQDWVTSSLAFLLGKAGLWKKTLVRIPRVDLAYAEWMGSLTLSEWSSPSLPTPRWNLALKTLPQIGTRRK